MFDKSEERIAIEKRLNEGNIGDVLLPQEVEAIIHMPSDGSHSRGYRLFYIAARVVERLTDGELCWRWIRDRRVYKCLSNDEKPDDISGRTDRIKRSASRNNRIFNSIDTSKLDPEKRAIVIASGAMNALITIAASRRSIKKLAAQPAIVREPDESYLIEFMKRRQ